CSRSAAAGFPPRPLGSGCRDPAASHGRTWMTTRRWLRPRSRRGLVLAVTAVASLSPIAACAPAPAAPPPASPVPRTAAPRLYAAPVNSLFAAAAHLRRPAPAEAAELRAIARTPAGFWAAGQPGEMQMI